MIIKLASMAYKSKCKECEVCCIKVKRDVDLEEKETEFIVNHTIKESPSNKYDLNEEKNSI
jgi:hypothetical protein